MINIENELENAEFIKANVGTSKTGTVEKGYLIYHIVQQAENRMSLFNASVAKHRDGLFKTQCNQHWVIPLANVIMPTHTHDLVLAKDVSDISLVFRNVNQGTAKFIRNNRRQNNQAVPVKVFNSRPGFKPVKNRLQLMILLKYLYDNPAGLKQRGEFVPYSCFDSWEQNYTKPYRTDLIEKILEIKLPELLTLCSTMDKTSFNSLAAKRYANDSEKLSNSIFKAKKA